MRRINTMPPSYRSMIRYCPQKISRIRGWPTSSTIPPNSGMRLSYADFFTNRRTNFAAFAGVWVAMNRPRFSSSRSALRVQSMGFFAMLGRQARQDFFVRDEFAVLGFFQGKLDFLHDLHVINHFFVTDILIQQLDESQDLLFPRHDGTSLNGRGCRDTPAGIRNPCGAGGRPSPRRAGCASGRGGR
jgi:hypothetical protein